MKNNRLTPDLARISIVGTSCAGKSTLARRLAERLELPHVQLDALAWGPNWQMRDDFEQRVDDAVARCHTSPLWAVCADAW